MIAKPSFLQPAGDAGSRFGRAMSLSQRSGFCRGRAAALSLSRRSQGPNEPTHRRTSSRHVLDRRRNQDKRTNGIRMNSITRCIVATTDDTRSSPIPTAASTNQHERRVKRHEGGGDAKPNLRDKEDQGRLGNAEASTSGIAFPAMISTGRNGVTRGWSKVPSSRSRATDSAVSKGRLQQAQRFDQRRDHEPSAISSRVKVRKLSSSAASSGYDGGFGEHPTRPRD
jgi:hypothetical protein